MDRRAWARFALTRAVRLLCRDLRQHIVGGGPVAVGVANLLEEDLAVTVEDEGGRICGLMWCVPPQAIEVGCFVIGVDDELDVGRQIGLLFQELPGVLIEVGRRAWIYEEHTDPPGCEVRCARGKVMNLPDAIGALVAGEAAQ